MNKKELLGGTLAGMMFLSGCSAAIETRKTPTVETVPTTAPTPAPTATEAPTPTAEAIFTAEAVAFVPKTEETIIQSVKITSPIDDEAGYKADFAKLKPAFDQILTDYSGKMINEGGTIGIDSGIGTIFFKDGNVLNPIASSYFEWEGHEVPILYFPAKDSRGKFVIGMIFSPTMTYISGVDSNGNLVYNVSLDDILKKFPISINGNGSVVVRYTNIADQTMTARDPLFAAYFSKHEDPNYQTVLWDYFLGENGKKLDFDRNYESSLLLLLNVAE